MGYPPCSNNKTSEHPATDFSITGSEVFHFLHKTLKWDNVKDKGAQERQGFQNKTLSYAGFLCFLQLMLCPAHQEKAATSAWHVGVLANLCGETSADFDRPYIPKAVLVREPTQIPGFPGSLFSLSVMFAFFSF